MRSPRRFRRGALVALSAGVLLAVVGCESAVDRTTKGTTGTAEAEDVLLQPLGEPGPGPFTESTARPVPSPSVTRSPQEGDGSATRTAHRVSGALPGLYGGVRSEAACDVEQQARLLTADQDRARAFAEVAGSRPCRSRAICARSPRWSCAPTPRSPTTASAQAPPPPSRPCSRRAPPSWSTAGACPGSAAPAAIRWTGRWPRRGRSPTGASAGPVTTPRGSWRSTPACSRSPPWSSWTPTTTPGSSGPSVTTAGATGPRPTRRPSSRARICSSPRPPAPPTPYRRRAPRRPRPRRTGGDGVPGPLGHRRSRRAAPGLPAADGARTRPRHREPGRLR